MRTRIAASLAGALLVAVLAVGVHHHASGGGNANEISRLDVGGYWRSGFLALAAVPGLSPVGDRGRADPAYGTSTPSTAVGDPFVSHLHEGAGDGEEPTKWQQFREGYLAEGGTPAWLEHFVNVVLPCESSYWGAYYDNGYVSRAQFDRGSWARSVEHTSLADPTDPFHVGVNVAYWSGVIDHPGTRNGWPTCWWN